MTDIQLPASIDRTSVLAALTAIGLPGNAVSKIEAAPSGITVTFTAQTDPLQVVTAFIPYTDTSGTYFEQQSDGGYALKE